MRIPDELTASIAFLLVETESGRKFGGTAFFVAVPGKDTRIFWGYLVTAKHNIERAYREHGSLFVRYNTKSGSDGFRIPSLERWLTADDDAVDVAAIPFNTMGDSELHPVNSGWFATSEVRREKNIGIGEDLIIPGLFRHRHGHEKNLPIIRRGMIASMAEEPLQDQYSGLEYQGFLAEVHSFGGLSGSPVLAHLAPGGAYGAKRSEFLLLGLIRGHWDAQTPLSSEFPQSEADGMNMGIAIVTPVDELVKILFSEDEVRSRAAKERAWLAENSPW